MSVTGAASDTVGVDHVALFADGVSMASTPAGQPATLVPFSLTWLATPAGPHVLQVIAYRADGTASDPAVANVVVGSGSFPAVSGGSLPPLTSPPPSSGGLITPATHQEAQALQDASATADAHARHQHPRRPIPRWTPMATRRMTPTTSRTRSS